MARPWPELDARTNERPILQDVLWARLRPPAVRRAIFTFPRFCRKAVWENTKWCEDRRIRWGYAAFLVAVGLNIATFQFTLSFR